MRDPESKQWHLKFALERFRRSIHSPPHCPTLPGSYIQQLWPCTQNTIYAQPKRINHSSGASDETHVISSVNCNKCLHLCSALHTILYTGSVVIWRGAAIFSKHEVIKNILNHFCQLYSKCPECRQDEWSGTCLLHKIQLQMIPACSDKSNQSSRGQSRSCHRNTGAARRTTTKTRTTTTRRTMATARAARNKEEEDDDDHNHNHNHNHNDESDKKIRKRCFKCKSLRAGERGFSRRRPWQAHSRPRNLEVLIRRSRLFVSCHLADT